MAAQLKTFKIHTLGCKVNQYDSQAIRGQLIHLGLQELTNGKKADCYIINTCTVTSSADRQSRNLIRSLRRQNPSACIIVTGCYAHLNTDAIEATGCADFIINNENKFSLGKILSLPRAQAQHEHEVSVKEFSAHARAFVKVQDGCDNFCSYCKVPYVRGRSRSRALDAVKRETAVLASNGHKEVVLTGICLGDYGKDLAPRIDLVDLIESIEGIKGLERIRLSSIEAKDVSDRLIEKMSSSKKLCEHLHIPFQSGDDTILKAMNRRNSSASYLKLLKALRRAVPHIGISTDIMIGFPGEGENEFKNTLAFLKDAQPMRVHIFSFAPRDHTALFQKNTTITPIVVKKRYEFMKALSDGLSLDFMSRFIGHSLEVLFEEKLNGFWRGYSRNYLPVAVRDDGRCLSNVISRVTANRIKNSIIEVSFKAVYNKSMPKR